MNKIAPSENLLVGQWAAKDGKVLLDEVCQRINELTHAYLTKIGSDPSGWGVLFRDPEDGRLWELTYPQSHLHGGGPPQLQALGLNEARQKYPGLMPSPGGRDPGMSVCDTLKLH